VPQRAFCPAQAVLLGRTDERAWTPLAAAAGATAAARHGNHLHGYDLQCDDHLRHGKPSRWFRAPELVIVAPSQKLDP
jgi:hypothetical protein